MYKTLMVIKIMGLYFTTMLKVAVDAQLLILDNQNSVRIKSIVQLPLITRPNYSVHFLLNNRKSGVNFE